jgi:1-acyl-sn-glycerol-3-phosphate acyltransferase
MNASPPEAGLGPVYAVSRHLLEMAHWAFFRGEVIGLGHLPAQGGFLIAANHASFLDPPFVGCHVPAQMAYFARKTLWRGGLATWWLDAVGCIPVDRDGGSDIAAIKHVLRTLQAGRSLVLFPEGTRSPDGNLQTAKAGVGLIACKAKVPVVPARIFGSFEAYGKGTRLPRLGTRVSVVYGRPLGPEHYDEPGVAKDRFQRASDRIMAEIARLEIPAVAVV